MSQHFAPNQISQLRQQGKFTQARAMALRAIKSGQKNATVYREMGLIALTEGQDKEGLHWLEKALAAQPDNGQILFDLGQAHFRFGEANKARDFFSRALALSGHNSHTLSWYAKSLYKCEQFEEGLRIVERLLLEEPHVADHYNLKGSLLNGLQRHHEALEAFMQAISLQPAEATYHSNLGNTFFSLKHYEETIQCCDTALLLDAKNINALNNKGYALKALKRYAEARTTFSTITQLNSHHTSGWLGLAIVDYEDFEYHSSIEHVQKLLRLEPYHLKGLATYGGALTQTGQYEAALVQFEKALKRDPHFHIARFGRAMGLLRRGHFAAGWEDHEARYLLDDLQSDRQLIDQIFSAMPRWDGDTDLVGRSLLVVYEQGFGDIIQFYRLLIPLADQGVNITLMLPVPLTRLLTDQHPRIAIHDSFHAIPRCDFAERLMTLPLRLKFDPLQTATGVPYLQLADPIKATWQQRMPSSAASPVKKVGLVWAGRPTHTNDRARSLHLAQLAPLFDLPNLTFYSLQKGGAEAQIEELGLSSKICNMNDAIEDFADSAGLLSQLDLLISVDSAPVHLAGALGTPVWTLIPFAPDWRWMVSGDTTPWYDSMRLFRQTQPNDWNSVIDQVKQQLQIMTDCEPKACL